MLSVIFFQNKNPNWFLSPVIRIEQQTTLYKTEMDVILYCVPNEDDSKKKMAWMILLAWSESSDSGTFWRPIRQTDPSHKQI